MSIASFVAKAPSILRSELRRRNIGFGAGASLALIGLDLVNLLQEFVWPVAIIALLAAIFFGWRVLLSAETVAEQDRTDELQLNAFMISAGAFITAAVMGLIALFSPPDDDRGILRGILNSTLETQKNTELILDDTGEIKDASGRVDRRTLSAELGDRVTFDRRVEQGLRGPVHVYYLEIPFASAADVATCFLPEGLDGDNTLDFRLDGCERLTISLEPDFYDWFSEGDATLVATQAVPRLNSVFTRSTLAIDAQLDDGTVLRVPLQRVSLDVVQSLSSWIVAAIYDSQTGLAQDQAEAQLDQLEEALEARRREIEAAVLPSPRQLESRASCDPGECRFLKPYMRNDFCELNPMELRLATPDGSTVALPVDPWCQAGLNYVNTPALCAAAPLQLAPLDPGTHVDATLIFQGGDAVEFAVSVATPTDPFADATRPEPRVLRALNGIERAPYVDAVVHDEKIAVTVFAGRCGEAYQLLYDTDGLGVAPPGVGEVGAYGRGKESLLLPLDAEQINLGVIYGDGAVLGPFRYELDAEALVADAVREAGQPELDCRGGYGRHTCDVTQRRASLLTWLEVRSLRVGPSADRLGEPIAFDLTRQLIAEWGQMRPQSATDEFPLPLEINEDWNDLFYQIELRSGELIGPRRVRLQ